MNWAQVKALNSTVGTPQFKPLDVVIGDMLDDVKGSMRRIDGFSPITIQPSDNWASANESDLTTLIASSMVADGFFVVEYKVVESGGRSMVFRTEPVKMAGATLNFVDEKMAIFGVLSKIYLRIYKPIDSVENNVSVSTIAVSAESNSYGESIELDYQVEIVNIYKVY